MAIFRGESARRPWTSATRRYEGPVLSAASASHAPHRQRARSPQDKYQSRHPAGNQRCRAQRRRACCHLDVTAATLCRHRRFFRDLEPYSEIVLMRLGAGEPQNVQVIGFPVIEPDGRILLAETIRPLGAPRQTSRLIGRFNLRPPNPKAAPPSLARGRPLVSQRRTNLPTPATSTAIALDAVPCDPRRRRPDGEFLIKPHQTRQARCQKNRHLHDTWLQPHSHLDRREPKHPNPRAPADRPQRRSWSPPATQPRVRA
jgi:hypothetical protein